MKNIKVTHQQHQDENAEIMTIMPLGGGQEVGRSCILLQYQGRNIMLDCGCHPGREGSDGLPFFDSLDNPEDIDLILITHFHIDHCAALPYFTEKTNFKGRIFMTHATKAVMKLLLADNIRLQFKTQPLYSEKDLQNCIDKIEVVDYHQTVEFKGIKFTATAAGHVLGAAMFMIDIDSIRVLYTGDYSLEEDRHLIQASVPPGGPPDVLIVESTFGVTNIASREKREIDFTNTVESIVRRGGSCLIPVFALGRAQELLLILDEYWKDNVDLQNIPVFYASKLATKSLRVYQTFINMMNAHIRDAMDTFNNPFKLKHIRSIQNNDFEVMGPSVVMASPGFLQSGVSRQLFEAWCDSERNGVIIAGYTIEGTLANDLLSFPTEIKCLDNRIKPRRCQIEYIAFSAHVDFNQNRKFIRAIMPDYIILVHGEKTQMSRLKSALDNEIRRDWSTVHKPSIATPENGVKVKLRFRKNIVANVIGSAATHMLSGMDGTSGNSAGVSIPNNAILVTENFNSKLVAASELSQFTNCKFNRIIQRLLIAIPRGLGFDQNSSLRKLKGNESKTAAVTTAEDTRLTETLINLILDSLEEIFDHISVHEETKHIVVEELVTLSAGYSNALSHVVPASEAARLLSSNIGSNGKKDVLTLSHVSIEWYAAPIADTVADCIAANLLSLFSTQNALRLSMSNAASAGTKKRKTNFHSTTRVNTTTSIPATTPTTGVNGTTDKTAPVLNLFDAEEEMEVDEDIVTTELTTETVPVSSEDTHSSAEMLVDGEDPAAESYPENGNHHNVGNGSSDVDHDAIAALLFDVSNSMFEGNSNDNNDGRQFVADEHTFGGEAVVESPAAADHDAVSALLNEVGGEVDHTDNNDSSSSSVVDSIEENTERIVAQLVAEDEALMTAYVSAAQKNKIEPAEDQVVVDLFDLSGDTAMEAVVSKSLILPAIDAEDEEEVDEEIPSIPVTTATEAKNAVASEDERVEELPDETAIGKQESDEQQQQQVSLEESSEKESVTAVAAPHVDQEIALDVTQDTATSADGTRASGSSSSSSSTEEGSADDGSVLQRAIEKLQAGGDGTDPSMALDADLRAAVNKPALKNLQTLLTEYNESLPAPFFQSISLNANEETLIFRSMPNKRYAAVTSGEDKTVTDIQMAPDKKKKTTVGAYEAYCFVLFDANNNHHAAVSCSYDPFRKAVLFALSNIGNL